MLPSLTRFLTRAILPARLHTASLCSSSSSSSSSAVEDEVSFESLKPSKSFEKTLKGDLKKHYAEVLKEFEIFVYMARMVPNEMSDETWKATLECESVNDRIGYWEYLAITARRANRKNNSAEFKKEQYRAKLAEQKKILDGGGMGYGPEMYQLISNPLRNQSKVNNWEGAKVLTSMKLEVPRVALDLQFIQEAKRREWSELGNQMQYCISENFSAKTPLVMDFVNSPPKEFLDEWLAKSVGYYTGSYQNQTIMPEFHTKGIREVYEDSSNIIYITPDAREVLDGPLTADVIGICVTKGKRREALGSARRAKIRTYRLPIHRYVKWKAGAQYLPFPNLLNVLREVYASGGDWSRALHNNISRRHLVDPNEDEKLKVQMLKRRAREEERRELTEAIISATKE